MRLRVLKKRNTIIVFFSALTVSTYLVKNWILPYEIYNRNKNAVHKQEKHINNTSLLARSCMVMTEKNLILLQNIKIKLLITSLDGHCSETVNSCKVNTDSLNIKFCLLIFKLLNI